MGNGGVLLDGTGDVSSEVGEMAGKLVCKGWKDLFEFPSVKIIPGTEKASTKYPLLGNHF